jgi:hypothetical protein
MLSVPAAVAERTAHGCVEWECRPDLAQLYVVSNTRDNSVLTPLCRLQRSTRLSTRHRHAPLRALDTNPSAWADANSMLLLSIDTTLPC